MTDIENGGSISLEVKEMFTHIKLKNFMSFKDVTFDLKKGSKRYPVHFSVSDTSGEKAFEEFYTEKEVIDKERFASLGVIVGKEAPGMEKMENLITMLNEAFENPSVTKEEIVKIIGYYIPDFNHIETGKSLDGKM